MARDPQIPPTMDFVSPSDGQSTGLPLHSGDTPVPPSRPRAVTPASDLAEQFRHDLLAQQVTRLEDFLARHPEVANRTALVMDLVYEEMILREERGDALDVEEYVRRFPALAAMVRRQWEVHQAWRQSGSASAAAVSYSSLGLDQPAGPVPPWKELPGYQVFKELGRGGMGVVYLAHDLALHRTVAIKVLGKNLSHPAYVTRFQAEAAALARLQHPHIVQVFAAGVHEGHHYFVMEYVNGGSLSDRLHGMAKAPADAARLVLLLARAVQAAHQQGIIHRDLKPDNVLLAPHADESALNCAWGWPKISDFGLVKFCGDRPAGVDSTAVGTILGTPSYMAPEQARGDVVGPAADVYALGVILYELLAGKRPIEGQSPMDTMALLLTQAPVPLRKLQPDAPPALEAICTRCLAKDPAQRYASPVDLAIALEEYLQNENPRVAGKAPLRMSRTKLLFGVLGVIALVLAAIGTGWGCLREREPASNLGIPVATQPSPVIAPQSSPATAPLIADWEILLHSPSKAGINVRQPGALPARAGEMVQIKVALNTPAYVYLLWIDGQGTTLPLYPWNAGDEIEKETVTTPPLLGPVPVLTSPPSSGKGWPLDKQSGLETILLLVRRTPLPKDVDLAALVKLPPAPLRHLHELTLRSYAPGSPPQIFNTDRGPEKKAAEIDEPLVQLVARLERHFEVIRAVRFAHQGE